MKKILISTLLTLLALQPVLAEEQELDISGDNTSSNYVSYSKQISLPEGDVLNVKMARYCYFSSKIMGTGVLNLFAGGERGYLGTASGKNWPDWTGFTGDIHIYPYPENTTATDFFAVVLAHGGKTCSPEDVDLTKVNPSMTNNRVILHQGATICTEAHTAGSAFRIGELQTEEGSTLQGYMKNGRAAYYLLGALNTDATLAGRIAPSGNRNDTPLGIIKEGTGTYRITGNDNNLNGALRVKEGRVLVMNDREATENGKLRGALGAMSDATTPIAYVFGKGVLGGTGSIGGSVDCYGTIEPGVNGIGQLTLKNYAEEKTANLFLHPGSVIRVKVGTAGQNNRLYVDGDVSYTPTTEDFKTGDRMPLIELEVADDDILQVGDEITVMVAKGKNDYDKTWNFDVYANKYTWEVVENITTGIGGNLFLSVRLVSLDKMEKPDYPDDPDMPESTIGAFYDDGINDNTDTNTLLYYAAKNGKNIGTAISTWNHNLSNPGTVEKEIANQFNMMVCENEMKPENLQPSKGSFSFGSADAIVNFAQKNNMVVRGHCLVWHSQLPTWISSDGKKNDKNWTREQALEIMKDHITKVMQHYRGKVKEWDVVNECLSDDQTIVRTNPNGYQLRPLSVWQLAIGDDYVDSAFVYAHRADPDALLYLNDYGVELQGKAKTEAFYNLAVRLKSKDIPIDGVGLQCHFSIGDVDSVKLDNTIKRFEEAGLKCIITELDMGIPSTSQDNLLEQARNYRVITDIVLNHDNCPSMVIWGVKDNNSWRESSSPLLYTASLGKKKAWYAVRSALRHRVLETDVRPVLYNDRANSSIYNLAGQRVNESYKGIVIVNGHKVVQK